MLPAFFLGSLLLTASGPCDTLPASLLDVLHRRLPGATLPASDSGTGHGNPYCATGNFDGVPGRDFVLVLKDSAGVRIVAFHRRGSTYEPYDAYTEGGRPMHLDGPTSRYSVTRDPPGNYEGLDAGDGIRTRHDAIRITEDEENYWNAIFANGRYHEVFYD